VLAGNAGVAPRTLLDLAQLSSGLLDLGGAAWLA